MAVTQTMQWFRERHYCLLADPRADAAEIVFEEGFYADQDDQLIDFLPAYFVDAKVQGVEMLDEITVRLDEETDRPIGLMIEHVSKRDLPKRGFLRRPETPEGATALLLRIADAVVFPEPLTPERPSGDDEPVESPLRRDNGGWVLEGRGIPLETAH